MLSCPATLYNSHLAPIVGPVFEHIKYRLDHSWAHILNAASISVPDAGKALTTTNCNSAAVHAARGGEDWFASYYMRSGIFVGELDSVTAEAAVEKYRVEITRTFCDMLQAVLALKGDWALVLANLAKEEQASRQRPGGRQIRTGPRNRIGNPPLPGQVNADGSPRNEKVIALEARKLLRINGICHFLFLENEGVAGSLSVSIIQVRTLYITALVRERLL